MESAKYCVTESTLKIELLVHQMFPWSILLLSERTPIWVLLGHGRSTVSSVTIPIRTSSPLGLQGPSDLNHRLTTVRPQPQQSNQPQNNLSPCSKTSRDSSVSFRMTANVLIMARKTYTIILLLEHLFPFSSHCPLNQH